MFEKKAGQGCGEALIDQMTYVKKLTIHSHPLYPPVFDLLPKDLVVDLLLHEAREDFIVRLEIFLQVESSVLSIGG